MSADVSVAFLSDALLFVPSGSDTSLDADAVFVWSPVVPDGTVYVAVTVSVAPETIVPRLHGNAEQPLPLTVPSVYPAGKTSLSCTSVASEGPALCTVIV